MKPARTAPPAPAAPKVSVQPAPQPTVTIPMDRLLQRLKQESDQLRFSLMISEETAKVLQEENIKLKATIAATSTDAAKTPAPKPEVVKDSPAAAPDPKE
jgi:hypothetical protein